jgi:RNA polymerase sigma-70 factor, ECF subfamily
MTKPLTPDTIRQAALGDRHAFRMLVESQQTFAYAVAFRFVGNAGDAEDIVQEAFVRLWKNLHQYRPEVKLSTWLYRIIANLCLDLLKSRPEKQRRSAVDIDHSHAVTDGSTPEADLYRRELMGAIHAAANELTPLQRAVFILRDLEDLPVEEVCDILCMPAGNVKSNLYYARRKVGERLKALYRTDKRPML